MAGEDPEGRKKHHRYPEGGTNEGSKRRKHSHHRSSHRHHHRHRSSKRDRDGEDLDVPPVVDDDKEEGEILEEGEFVGAFNGSVEKRKSDSDAESGEIKSDDLFDRSDYHRNLGGHDDGFSGKLFEGVESDTDIPQCENGLLGNSTPDVRDNNTECGLHECLDKTLKKMDDEVDEPKNSKDVHFNFTGEDSEIGEFDESNTGSGSVKLSENKGERRRSSSSHREGTPNVVNGDIGGHKSRRKDPGNESSLKSPREGTEMKKDSEILVLRRHGRSRSPSHRKENDSRKHRKRDARGVKTDKYRDVEENDSASHVPRTHVESMDFERNSLRNGNMLVSPEVTDDKCTIVVHSPSHDVYHEEAHTRNRSWSRDHVRERRSQSRSYLQDEKVYHAESYVKSYRDNNNLVKLSGSREKDRHESDLEKVVRHDREQRRGSRDLTRDRERERSSSYSRHNVGKDRHGSWDTWDKERERGWDSERERSSSYSRHGYRDNRHDSLGNRDRERARERDMHRERERERERERDKHRDKIRDDDRDRGERNREREREKERGRDGYKDSRHLNHDDSEHHRDRKRYRGQDKPEMGEEKLKRDEDEQEDYEERVELKLAAQEEEDIEKIKEESRKRREAIIEKYRQQQLQKQLESESEGSRKANHDRDPSTLYERTEKSSTCTAVVNSVGEGFLNKNDGSDVSDADPLFSVGKSPQKNGSSAFGRTLGAGGLGDGTPKSERSEDMFCDDIFGESPAGVRKKGKGDGLQVERSGLNDNWDDAEGYYSYRFGEVLDGRYEVIAAHGKGVFSTVVRAKDLKAGKGEPEEVAIKIIRSNDTMYKAGLEELIILKKLAGADPEDRRHCVRFLSSFKYRNHLCLVFESLHMNLREVLKKFGRNIGLKLTAVRAYAKQLFIALKHLRNCGVLHCDIKPDNMLVNEAKNVLKLCDFGNAMFAGKNEITPYLVSRFYRAPEIILGLSYDHPMDMWSVGCCLYELYSGKVLFPGPSNNDMLRLHMELKGPFPKKMLRKGAFADQHFDHDLNFYSTEEDPVTKKTLKRLVVNHKPKDIGTIITGSAGEDPKMLANFKDLLERIFLLDPDKRLTVSQALNHPFITGK